MLAMKSRPRLNSRSRQIDVQLNTSSGVDVTSGEADLAFL